MMDGFVRLVAIAIEKFKIYFKGRTDMKNRNGYGD